MTSSKLPLPWTEFVGRERECASLKRLLLRARLVTVVGLSGVGKTRLALQVAEGLLPEFNDSIWFASCDGLNDTAALLPGVREASGLRQDAAEDWDQWAAALAGRRALLFLDSAECLLGAGLRELLPQLLERVSGLSLLLTSQAETGLAGEHLFPLRAMYPPRAAESQDRGATVAWLESDALRLFEARAQQRDCEWQLTPANLNTVVELCREVDWLPLGIELAAGQLSPWTESQLLEQIRQRGHQLDLAAPQGMERHRSLRNAISWSWSQLSRDEQGLLAVLAALGGEAFEEALEPLTGELQAPALAAALFRKGFLKGEERAGRQRYWLPRPTRRFVLDQDGVPATELGRGAAFYLELARREGERIGTAQAAAASDALRLEEPMLRRCWAWAREQGDGERLRGFAGALWGPLLNEMPLALDARELAAAALAHTPASGEDAARLAWVAGAVAARLGPVEEAAPLLRRCQEPDAPEAVRALALKELAWIQVLQGQLLAACDSFQQSLAVLSRLGLEGEAAWARQALAVAYERLGDLEGAERYFMEALLQFSDLELPFGQARACVDLARLAADREQWETALHQGEEGMRRFEELGHGGGWGEAMLQVARVRASQGMLDEAQRLYREGLRRLRLEGTAAQLCHALLQAAAEREPRVSPLESTKAYRECIALARERGLRSLLAHALRGLAEAYATDGRTERAMEVAQEAVQVARETTETPLIQACLELHNRLQGSQELRGRIPGASLPARPAYHVQIESLTVRERELSRSTRKRIAAAEHESAEGTGRGRVNNWPPAATRRLSAGPVGPVRVRLLGGINLYLGDEEVPLLDWWAKAKKLFAYLVIHRGRPVSRDILLEEFWADGDQQRAIHSLQTTLSFLRRSLRSLPGGQALTERLIIARDGNYVFDSEGRCESDLHLFDHHVQEGARLKAAERLEEAAVHWTEADRLYVGDLLPDFPYEDWCASPRERLRSQYLELMLNLAMYHRQGQRPREALRAAERMFTVDGCDERAHRMIMRCHVMMGRPVDALRQFERCCQVLQRELSVQPSKLTRDLYELIRQRMGEVERPVVESPGATENFPASAL